MTLYIHFHKQRVFDRRWDLVIKVLGRSSWYSTKACASSILMARKLDRKVHGRWPSSSVAPISWWYHFSTPNVFQYINSSSLSLPYLSSFSSILDFVLQKSFLSTQVLNATNKQSIPSYLSFTPSHDCMHSTSPSSPASLAACRCANSCMIPNIIRWDMWNGAGSSVN